jgi:hypothetical protein
LIELLIALVMGALVLMGLTMGFVSDRALWSAGIAQSESQRDAQVALRAIARAARESNGYTITATPDSTQLNFAGPFGGLCVEGGAAFEGGRLALHDDCAAPVSTTYVIDGLRSRVTTFFVTPISTRLIRIQLEVAYRDRGTELLETEVLLRNANAT